MTSTHHKGRIISKGIYFIFSVVQKLITKLFTKLTLKMCSKILCLIVDSCENTFWSLMTFIYMQIQKFLAKKNHFLSAKKLTWAIDVNIFDTFRNGNLIYTVFHFRSFNLTFFFCQTTLGQKDLLCFLASVSQLWLVWIVLSWELPTPKNYYYVVWAAE